MNNDKITKYIDSYIEKNNEILKENIDLFLYLRKNTRKLKEITKIINNDIMLKIHKREKIEDIMKKKKKSKHFHSFIDKLITNGYEKLQHILIHSNTINNSIPQNENEYIFKYFQIKKKEYLFIFDIVKIKSQYIRDGKFSI